MAESPESKQFGPWTVLERLGRGGFGSVFKVQRIITEETAPRLGALKLMTEKKGRDLREQSRAEINALSQVDSMYIAGLIDANLDDDQPWFVSAFIDGKPLYWRQVILGKFSEFEWLKMAHNLFMALKETHGRGIAHRDIKPDNVIYADKNEVYVLVDFGLAIFIDAFYANLVSASPSLKSLAGKSGTFLYQAPEQTEGLPDLSSDVFAAGTLLYQMLSGINPWLEALGISPEDDAKQYKDEIIDAIKNREPLYRGLTDDQCLFLRALLAKDPINRLDVETALNIIKNWQATGNLEQSAKSLLHSTLEEDQKYMEISWDTAFSAPVLEEGFSQSAGDRKAANRQSQERVKIDYDEVIRFFDQLPEESFSIAISIEGHGTIGLNVLFEDGRYYLDFKLKNLKMDFTERNLERILLGSSNQALYNERRFDAILDSRVAAQEIGQRLVEYLKSRFGDTPPRIRIY